MPETLSQESSDPKTPKPKRRWLQFNLRTLLVLTLVVGSGLGWVMNERRKNSRIQTDIEALERFGNNVDGPSQPSPFDWLFNRNPIIVTYVSLSGNSINDTELVHLKGFRDLSELLLARTAITDGGLEHLKGFTNLRSLYLDGTSVTDAGLVFLKGLMKLKVLSLRNTKVTDAGLVHLKGLTKLESLDLNDTAITDAGLGHLNGLTKLRVLSLDGTAFSDSGMVYLKGLTNFTFLSFNDTAITDDGLEHLKGLDLSTLYLERTNVTRDGVAELQKALPNCEIFHSSKN